MECHNSTDIIIDNMEPYSDEFQLDSNANIDAFLAPEFASSSPISSPASLYNNFGSMFHSSDISSPDVSSPEQQLEQFLFGNSNENIDPLLLETPEFLQLLSANEDDKVALEEIVTEKPKRGRKKRQRKEGEDENPDVSAVSLTKEQLLTFTSEQYDEIIAPILSTRQLTSYEEKEVKRQRRLIKNRESAHASRQRKKQYVDELEGEIQVLKNENVTLRNQVHHLSSENKSLKEQLENLTKTIRKTYLPPNKVKAGVALMVVMFSFGLFFNNLALQNGASSPPTGAVLSNSFSSSVFAPQRPGRTLLEYPDSSSSNNQQSKSSHFNISEENPKKQNDFNFYRTTKSDSTEEEPSSPSISKSVSSSSTFASSKINIRDESEERSKEDLSPKIPRYSPEHPEYQKADPTYYSERQGLRHRASQNSEKSFDRHDDDKLNHDDDRSDQQTRTFSEKSNEERSFGQFSEDSNGVRSVLISEFMNESSATNSSEESNDIEDDIVKRDKGVYTFLWEKGLIKQQPNTHYYAVTEIRQMTVPNRIESDPNSPQYMSFIIPSKALPNSQNIMENSIVEIMTQVVDISVTPMFPAANSVSIVG